MGRARRMLARTVIRALVSERNFELIERWASRRLPGNCPMSKLRDTTVPPDSGADRISLELKRYRVEPILDFRSLAFC